MVSRPPRLGAPGGWLLRASLDLAGPAPSRFAVRPRPPHRRKALSWSPPDGLGAGYPGAAGLSRLSQVRTEAATTGTAVVRTLPMTGGHADSVTASVFCEPASTHRACSPRFTAHAAGLAGGGTENGKLSRTRGYQRRADAVRLYRGNQVSKCAGGKRNDNDRTSASRSAPHFAGNQGEIAGPPDPAPQPDPPLRPADPGAWPARDLPSRRQHKTSEDDGRAGTGSKALMPK